MCTVETSCEPERFVFYDFVRSFFSFTTPIVSLGTRLRGTRSTEKRYTIILHPSHTAARKSFEIIFPPSSRRSRRYFHGPATRPPLLLFGTCTSRASRLHDQRANRHLFTDISRISVTGIAANIPLVPVTNRFYRIFLKSTVQ